jgi:hypothetical protein
MDAADIADLARNEPEIRRTQIEAIIRYVGRVLNSAAKLTEDDPPWLWKLRLQGAKAADDPILHAEITKALREGNAGLLHRFYEVGASLPAALTDDQIDDQILQIEKLLLEGWLARDGANFFCSFCYHSDISLSKLVNFMAWGKLEGSLCNQKSIRKKWERLGLKKASTLLFKDVEIRDGKLFPVPFKKLRQ